MNRFWWVAFACFIAAGVLAILNVYIFQSVWVHIAALWLIFPMAVWAVLHFTRPRQAE